jgi:hypothetical protein
MCRGFQRSCPTHLWVQRSLRNRCGHAKKNGGASFGIAAFLLTFAKSNLPSSLSEAAIHTSCSIGQYGAPSGYPLLSSIASHPPTSAPLSGERYRNPIRLKRIPQSQIHCAAHICEAPRWIHDPEPQGIIDTTIPKTHLMTHRCAWIAEDTFHGLRRLNRYGAP